MGPRQPRRLRTEWARFLCEPTLSFLFLYKRQKPHEPRAFDGSFNGSLLLRCEAAFAARHDAPVRIDELFQEVHVFVVNVLDIVLSENVVGHTLFKMEYRLD